MYFAISHIKFYKCSHSLPSRYNPIYRVFCGQFLPLISICYGILLYSLKVVTERIWTQPELVVQIS